MKIQNEAQRNQSSHNSETEDELPIVAYEYLKVMTVTCAFPTEQSSLAC